MPSNEFRIITTWNVLGSAKEVADILTDPTSFPRWWGDVYLGITILEKGDERGIGETIAVHSKGWLPYQLNWTGKLVSEDLPHSWRIEATGDLVGKGEWRLSEAEKNVVTVTYDWIVVAERPLFRLLSPILKPVFAWNHRWAMAKGLQGLRRELLLRRSQPMRP
jgi:hypothetical protein